MKTILYTKANNIEQELKSLTVKRLPALEFVTVHTIQNLFEKISQPVHKISVVILHVESMKALVQFKLMSHFFDNIRVVLILPDRKKGTIELGLKISPSYISYIDDNLDNIIDVLQKIMTTTAKK